jgi:hypothetical protein
VLRCCTTAANIWSAMDACCELETPSARTESRLANVIDSLLMHGTDKQKSMSEHDCMSLLVASHAMPFCFLRNPPEAPWSVRGASGTGVPICTGEMSPGCTWAARSIPIGSLFLKQTVPRPWSQARHRAMLRSSTSVGFVTTPGRRAAWSASA